MSMPKIETQENPVDREQSINDLIESVALVETGLSHIINAEGEKIQKVIKYGEDTEVPIDDILKVNDSAEKMVNTVSKLEMILQNKLDTSKCLGKTSDSNNSGSIIPFVGVAILSTLDDGRPENGRLISFSNAYDYYDFGKVTLAGNVEEFDVIISPTAYMMPRDGILTSFSAFYEVSGLGVSADTYVTARLYIAESDSSTYHPVDGAIINLPPIISTGEETKISGTITDLNIKLPANSKIVLLFYANSTQRIDLRGNAGGGINIK